MTRSFGVTVDNASSSGSAVKIDVRFTIGIFPSVRFSEDHARDGYRLAMVGFRHSAKPRPMGTQDNHWPIKRARMSGAPAGHRPRQIGSRPSRRAAWPAAWQRPRLDARICGGEVSSRCSMRRHDLYAETLTTRKMKGRTPADGTDAACFEN